MRKLIALIAAWQWLAMVSVAQGQSIEIPTPSKNGHQDLTSFFENRQQFDAAKQSEDYYVLLHFNNIPTAQEREQLNRQDIKLLSHISGNTYRAIIPKALSRNKAEQLGIAGIGVQHAEEKLAADLKGEEYPAWADAGNGKVDVAIVFAAKAPINEIKAELRAGKAEILNDKHRNGRVVEARLSKEEILKLAASPIVAHIDVIQEPVQRLNYETCTHQRVNVLGASGPGGRNLRGEGVVIGVGDGGQLGDHIDFDDRVINKANGTYSSFGAHGDHVAGIIGGGGNLNPRNGGMAPEATLITQKTSLITFYTEDYYNNENMVLTNNSYGTSASCTTNGTYNYTSSNLDWQLNELPELMHVFAAGNSGAGGCDPYPQGYRTVLRYYQSSKNVLTVGSVTEDRELWLSSSRGPVEDGRLKPELCGIGASVMSTGRDYDYWSANGTSMSSPSVTGTLALLYERYRQLHSGQNPEGALIKAIACNTADDLGNTGPDYAYGFGLVNGRRAVETIEENRFMRGSISTGESKTHTINVPSGTRQLKVMLYWSDKEAEAYPTKALVNDLNLKVINSSNTTYLPWVLNHDPSAVDQLAQRKIDTLNNIEQVTIDIPADGQYTLEVNGGLIPFGPQNYFLTYEFIGEEVTLTFPFGSEKLIPGLEELIQWDTDPTNTKTFKIEYSLDNGTNWSTIADFIPANLRTWKWTVPEAFTVNAKVKVSKNGGTSAVNAEPFMIMKRPEGLVAIPKCEGIVELQWNRADEAAKYEVMMFDGSKMSILAAIPDTQYLVLNGMEIGEKYWFAVRAKTAAGKTSQRTIAIHCVPSNDDTCPWNNDPKIIGIKIDVERGRYATVSALSNRESMNVNIKNIGDNAISNFYAFYQINENPPVSELVTTTIESGDSLLYSFQQKADFSDIGKHVINAWVRLDGDTNTSNDTIIGGANAVQLDNEPVSFPMKSTVDNAVGRAYTETFYGLEGITNWDYQTTGNGVLKVYDGLFYVTPLDPTAPEPVDNDVMMTLNLSSYDINSNYFYLKFKYAYNKSVLDPLSTTPTSTSKVWVRGADTEEWVELIGLNQLTGEWVEHDLLSLNNALVAAGQDLSPSVQIRFSQQDAYGYTLGNISVYQAAVLPVDYQEFKVSKLEDNTLVRWTTASEKNSDYFEIELADNDAAIRSNNFRKIGHVDAKGNGNGSWDYEFIDTEAGKSGVRYYRLKQYDLNGEFSYSSLKSVKFDQPASDISFFPNPFQNDIQFVYTPKATQQTRFILTDAQGRVVQQFDEQVLEGEKINFTIGKGLPAGAYFMHVVTDLSRSSYPIIKQQL